MIFEWGIYFEGKFGWIYDFNDVEGSLVDVIV